MMPLAPLDIALIGDATLAAAAITASIVTGFAIHVGRRHAERADHWRHENDFWRRQAGAIDEERAALSERVTDLSEQLASARAELGRVPIKGAGGRFTKRQDASTAG